MLAGDLVMPLDGLAYHVTVCGRGPALLLLHGFTGRGAMQSWAAGRAAAELATARRFETVDCTPLRPTRFAEGQLVRESLLI